MNLDPDPDKLFEYVVPGDDFKDEGMEPFEGDKTVKNKPPAPDTQIKEEHIIEHIKDEQTKEEPGEEECEQNDETLPRREKPPCKLSQEEQDRLRNEAIAFSIPTKADAQRGRLNSVSSFGCLIMFWTVLDLGGICAGFSTLSTDSSNTKLELKSYVDYFSIFGNLFCYS